MTANEIRASFLKYFEQHGHRVGAELAARPRRRSDAAVHQRRDEPVQGPVSRPREARLHPRHDLAEVHAGQRQAQRPRQRRAVTPPSHLLRDARQLLLRRLLQEGGAAVRVDAADRGLEDAGRQAGRLDLQGRERHPARRRGLRHLARPWRAGRPHPRARRRRQLLADGRHRPVRPLLGDLLRARRQRRRSGDRNLEQRVHGVRAQRRRHADAAAGAVDRHRHGPRAHHRGAAGQGLELRHRRLHAAARPRSAGCRNTPTARA